MESVKVGQVWRDKDKRMGNRHARVVSIQGAKATMARYNLWDLSTNTSKYAVTKVSLTGLQTRWVLVLPAPEDLNIRKPAWYTQFNPLTGEE